MMHPTKLLLAACAAAALVPATAGAATVSMENGTLTYRGDGAEGLNLLLTSRAGDDNVTQYLSFYDTGRDTLTNATGGYCFTPANDASALLCQRDLHRPILIEGSDARDSLSIFSDEDVPASIPIEIRGRGGDDQIKDAYDSDASRTFDGGAGNDTIAAYLGNDVVLGGDGNDDLDGGAGNDQIHAGAGDDILAGDKYKTPGADVMDGGAGFDQVDEWNDPSSSSTHPQPSVSLDGQANDGRPGEGDNVIDVEKFTSHVSMVFSGGDAAETVDVTTPSDQLPSILSGGGGNDQLTAYDYDDKVDGGAGDDRLFGGFGNDTVVGGPGKDTIYGDQTSSYCGYYTCKIPFGNDVIDAADGEVDQVDCGVGEDTAKVDAVDVVVNCEKVEKAGAGAGATPTGTQGGQPGATTTTAPQVVVVGKAARSALKKGTLALQLECAAACRISATGTVGAKTAKKLRLRTRTLATGSSTLLSGGKATVKLKLAKGAAKKLGRVRGKLAVAVKLTVTASDGTKSTVTKQLSLS